MLKHLAAMSAIFFKFLLWWGETSLRNLNHGQDTRETSLDLT